MIFAVKISLALFLSSIGKHTAAMTALGTAAAGVMAFEIGTDPWPWILGGMACTVVYAYKPPESRAKALANAVICIFLGGVFAPWIASLEFTKEWLGKGGGYVLCFVIPASWPWTAPVIFDRFKQVVAALTFQKGK
jgi:hypothetical protein